MTRFAMCATDVGDAGTLTAPMSASASDPRVDAVSAARERRDV